MEYSLLGFDSPIAIVEDVNDDASWIIDGLQEVGFTNVEIFPNGARFLSAFNEREELPRLVFLDNNLPKKDGFEVLTEIERYIDSEEISVCLMSRKRPDWFDKVSPVIRIIIKGKDPLLFRRKIQECAQHFLLPGGI